MSVSQDPVGSVPPQNGTSSASWVSLKARIKQHYDLASTYYYQLWGEHIHHGYFVPPTIPKEEAQIKLIELLVKQAGGLSQPGLKVLDVGCGIGGTTRYLAREHRCQATGVTISDEQVRIARKLSGGEEQGDQLEFIPISSSATPSAAKAGGSGLPSGCVRFIELDAERLGDYFRSSSAPADGAPFDVVWISEALSHFPDKALFFRNAARVLQSQGGSSTNDATNGDSGHHPSPTPSPRERRLVLADWFKAPSLSAAQHASDIAPIEDGMLLPPLGTVDDYVGWAKAAGFEVLAEPFDISKDVAQTWDLSLRLVADPKLWALALTQGRDFVAFLRAFSAMRTGYRNGTFRYAVMTFRLP